eukprot:TRINITY_DN27888_c0_g1_i1.p1 TRINITY_DN27888_c0_g1~~TRINITY_DN27888_c0_g1_i1.p1  ORF type:complete len:829 (+),score=166.57 TRINITY_DN27888_c0_g1_i1:113-2599(+)
MIGMRLLLMLSFVVALSIGVISGLIASYVTALDFTALHDVQPHHTPTASTALLGVIEQTEHVPGLIPAFISPQKWPVGFRVEFEEATREVLDNRIRRTQREMRRLPKETANRTEIRKVLNATMNQLLHWDDRVAKEGCAADYGCLAELKGFLGELGTKEKVVNQVWPNRDCRMSNCFNWSRCQGPAGSGRGGDGAESRPYRGFSFYMYSWNDDQVSPQFRLLLRALSTHERRTFSPHKACLFIVPLDMFDRDPRSRWCFNVTRASFEALPYWNGGLNHIVFNHFAGTYPNYLSTLDVDIGKAILAQASPSRVAFRQGFDIALPHLPPDNNYNRSCPHQSRRSLLASFKGKVYKVGKSAELRKAVIRMHDGEEIVAIAPCDTNFVSPLFCSNATSNLSYTELMCASAFALVPRGRRLGTFRLLEVMSAGAVPVLFADDLVLPFDDMLPWAHVVITVPEANVDATLHVLRAYSPERIRTLRENAAQLFQRYFASLPVILDTMFLSLVKRARPHLQHWNGARGTEEFFAGKLNALYPINFGVKLPPFTLVMLTYNRPLYHILKVWDDISHLHKVIVVSNNCSVLNFQDPGFLPRIHVDIEVYCAERNSLNSRFLPLSQIATEAVLSMDDDIFATCDEIMFAYAAWLQNPSTLVGFPARRHLFNSSANSFEYSSLHGDTYSLVLTGAAFFHSLYLTLYTFALPPSVLQHIDQNMNCEDIAMNFLVGHHSKRAPVKATGRTNYTSPKFLASGLYKSQPKSHFNLRNTCMQLFVKAFGYNPLLHSFVRADPVIYDGWVKKSLGSRFNIQGPSQPNYRNDSTPVCPSLEMGITWA